MALQSIIDRRLAGKNKSIGNRERFLRRYKDQVKEAVKRAIDGRGIRDIERGRPLWPHDQDDTWSLKPSLQISSAASGS